MNSPFKSPWHFDKFREDKEGEYVKIVGRFVGDWSDEIELMRGDLVTKFNEKVYNKQGYGHAANIPSENHIKEDAENPDGDPTARIFSHFKFGGYEDQLPKTQAMTDFFKFDLSKKFTKKLDDQMPNDQLMWHIDNLPGNPTKEFVHSKDFKYQEPNKLRFLIMLEDHQPGQIAQFGNIVYTQWRAGTIFTWDWSTLPHVTWNGSWYKRMALQLTGTGSRETWDIVKKGNKDAKYCI
jgi:uncharacterized protein YqgQ